MLAANTFTRPGVGIRTATDTRVDLRAIGIKWKFNEFTEELFAGRSNRIVGFSKVSSFRWCASRSVEEGCGTSTRYGLKRMENRKEK